MSWVSEPRAIRCDACGNELRLPTTVKAAESWEVHEYVHRDTGELIVQIHTCGCDKSPARVARFIKEEMEKRP